MAGLVSQLLKFTMRWEVWIDQEQKEAGLVTQPSRQETSQNL